jgi:hypothetical protein
LEKYVEFEKWHKYTGGGGIQPRLDEDIDLD